MAIFFLQSSVFCLFIGCDFSRRGKVVTDRRLYNLLTPDS